VSNVQNAVCLFLPHCHIAFHLQTVVVRHISVNTVAIIKCIPGHCPSAGILVHWIFVFHYLLLSKTLIKNFKVKVDSWNPSTYHLEVDEISTPRRFRGPCYNRVAVFLFCLFGIVFVVNPSHYTMQREEKNSSTITPGTSKTTRCANFINLQEIRTWILTINFNFKILIGVSLNNR
jgi:hypothetical protein